MVVIVLSQSQLPVGGKEKQAFDGLNFLNVKMVELTSQLKKEKSAGASPGEDQ